MSTQPEQQVERRAERVAVANRVFFFESHPVQYKAPVYQALQKILPDGFEVIYASDFSVRGGNVDREFGKEVKWDTPLLEGYRYRVLGNEKGQPATLSGSLTGRGIFSLLRRERPRAVVLTHFYYRFDQAAYLSALALGIPILIRQETQDDMFAEGRSAVKARLRSLFYRLMYSQARHAFCFGALNYEHLVRHGVAQSKISFARFSVPNALSGWSDQQLQTTRDAMRTTLGVLPAQTVVAFFGKFIPKKNPDLIFEALGRLSESDRKNIFLLFVGAGELQDSLREQAAAALRAWGVPTHFAGFVNQTRLPPYYLAADIMVLPSRRMGEAWGLVVNEALQAGCAVVVTDAVGCQKEFGDLSRARVIPVGGVAELAQALSELQGLERDFSWCRERMAQYSSEAAASTLQRTLSNYLR